MKKKSILHLVCLLFSCLAIFGGVFLLTDTAIVDNNIEVSDEVEAADPVHRKAYKGKVYYSPTGDGDFKYTTYLSGENGTNVAKGTASGSVSFVSGSFWNSRLVLANRERIWSRGEFKCFKILYTNRYYSCREKRRLCFGRFLFDNI